MLVWNVVLSSVAYCDDLWYLIHSRSPLFFHRISSLWRVFLHTEELIHYSYNYPVSHHVRKYKCINFYVREDSLLGKMWHIGIQRTAWCKCALSVCSAVEFLWHHHDPDCKIYILWLQFNSPGDKLIRNIRLKVKYIYT